MHFGADILLIGNRMSCFTLGQCCCEIPNSTVIVRWHSKKEKKGSQKAIIFRGREERKKRKKKMSDDVYAVCRYANVNSQNIGKVVKTTQQGLSYLHSSMA